MLAYAGGISALVLVLVGWAVSVRRYLSPPKPPSYARRGIVGGVEGPAWTLVEGSQKVPTLCVPATQSDVHVRSPEPRPDWRSPLGDDRLRTPRDPPWVE